MKNWTLACFLGLALLSACSNKDSSQDANATNGAGGVAGYGAGGPRGMGGMGHAGGAGSATPGSEEDLVQSAGDRIFFDTDRYTIAPQAASTLDRQAAWVYG